jgi:NRAMP (natural resistance-associated macrophage protein)-like metal ion transporter
MASSDVNHRDNDGSVSVDDEDEGPDPPPGEPLKFRFSWRKLWRFTGPGWLMSLAYLDPGNLESSLQMGAYTRFALLWVLWWATVMGLLLQEMSARLGLVTGQDLAQMVRAHYPRWVTYVVYVMMEIAVIGADIQEVVGSGVALNLMFGWPVWVGCLVTGFDTFTFLAIQYLGVRYLEALICLLIGTMAVCFFVNWGASSADAGALLAGWIVPTMPSYALTQTIGTIGAVIMPHNLYLHSGLVLSRKVARSSAHRVHAAICYARIEAAGALLFAFFINLAVVATNSAVRRSAFPSLDLWVGLSQSAPCWLARR